MKLKKLLFTVLILVLAFSIIAAGSYATKIYTIKRGETKEFTNGRAGISFVNSQYTGSVKIARPTSTRGLGDDHPDFTKPMLDVRLTNSKNERVTHTLGSVYVFFKVRRAEVRAWEEGRLGVYFYDTWTKEWVDCGTFEVRDGATSALGCRLRVYGLYGIAAK